MCCCVLLCVVVCCVLCVLLCVVVCVVVVCCCYVCLCAAVPIGIQRLMLKPRSAAFKHILHNTTQHTQRTRHRSGVGTGCFSCALFRGVVVAQLIVSVSVSVCVLCALCALCLLVCALCVCVLVCVCVCALCCASAYQIEWYHGYIV